MMKNNKNIFLRLFNALFPKEAEIQIIAFNILAIGGVLVSFFIGLYNLILGGLAFSLIFDLLGIVFSVLMLWYTTKTGKYKVAMILTVVIVFLGLFTGIFFSTGGYLGGLPMFFPFALVFTAFLLEGRTVAILTVIEMAWYATICVIAYRHPELVKPLESEKNIVIDVVICSTISSFTLVLAMYFQIRVYKQKQKELAIAREIAEKTSNAKSDFLAKMSHDIRTPLNTVMSMNELILQNTSSDEIREWTSDSTSSCVMLLSLLNDMLDISKIESGKVDITIDDYSPAELIRTLYVTWDKEAKNKGLKLIFKVDPSLPSVLVGSFDSNYKIFSNLISNAIKYTDTGEVIFNASLVEPGKYQVTISDTGIGIPEEFLEKIFTPFDRGAQEYYQSREGSGLGLAIVKDLADSLGVDIKCESVVDQGTVFTLTYHEEIADSTPIGNVEDWLYKKNVIGDNNKDFIIPEGRILVVDDNYYNRKVLRALLEPLLIAVDDVESGEEACEMVEIRDYDLILMDLRMPGMNGEETFKAIKDNDPEFNVPVVALTADAMLGVKERLLSEGFDAFITKPVNMNQLKTVLKTYMKDKLHELESDAVKELDPEKVTECDQALMPYGLSLQNALENNGNRTDSLLVRVTCFLDYYENTLKDLKSFHVGEEDTANFYCTVHSLKSSSSGIGAFTLSQLAAIIERRNDDTFSTEALPLLIKELETAHSGCILMAEYLEANK